MKEPHLARYSHSLSHIQREEEEDGEDEEEKEVEEARTRAGKRRGITSNKQAIFIETIAQTPANYR